MYITLCLCPLMACETPDVGSYRSINHRTNSGPTARVASNQHSLAQYRAWHKHHLNQYKRCSVLFDLNIHISTVLWLTSVNNQIKSRYEDISQKHNPTIQYRLSQYVSNTIQTHVTYKDTNITCNNILKVNIDRNIPCRWNYHTCTI